MTGLAPIGAPVGRHRERACQWKRARGAAPHACEALVSLVVSVLTNEAASADALLVIANALDEAAVLAPCAADAWELRLLAELPRTLARCRAREVPPCR